MPSELSPVPNDLEFEATIRRLEVTSQVFDRYKLLRILGRGGMGVVWLAHDERLDREVALKFLPDEIGIDPEAEDEMKRETRRCLELTHPNIVRIYDFVKDRQAAAISMEYIDGKTLSSIKLERPKRVFEVNEIKPWITQACRALSYAHEEVGVIHRDLKPGNLMLTSRGQIKIADFGIAQSVSDSMAKMTIRRGTSGTLSYMSPQQMNGEVSKVTDDIYAMGATLYELLTGKPPFHSGNVSFQLRVMIPPTVQERRDEWEIRGAEIPQDWEDAIAACLTKMPEERPGSMHELAERLGLVAVQHSAPQKQKRAAWRIPPKWVEAVQRVAKAARERAVSWRLVPYRKVALAVGSSVGIALLLGAFWHFVLWPEFAPRAEISVTSTPPGATVHIPGRVDVLTPCAISGLRIGNYSLTLSAAGYDSVHRSVHLDAGAKLDLGTINLARAYGQWAVTTLPRHSHYVLTGAADTGNFVKEGFTPDLISSLPAGNYTVVISQSNLAPYSESIAVPAHGAKVQEVDLIQASLTGDLNDAAARAFRGETDPNALNAQGKIKLIGLCNHAFERYLADGLLARAAEQLDRLKQLKADVFSAEAALKTKRLSKEIEVSAEMTDLINSHRFASAAELLKSIDEELERDSIARLNTRFQSLLTAYGQQIDADLKRLARMQSGVAQAQAQKWVTQYPDDVKVQLASANLLTQLPPDHDKLAAQLDALHRLAGQNKTLLTDPAVLNLSATLGNELRQTDALLKKINDSKSALDTATGCIARLKSQKDAYDERRIGRPKVNPFASTLNFFGKVVTGHSVVATEPVFSSQQEKEEALASVQTQIDAAQLSLTPLQAALADAQKHYNEFAAVVPWGQE